MDLLNRTKVIYGDKEYTYSWPVYLSDRASNLAAYGLRQVGPIPQHIAFCMDGNRRFAQKEHLDAGKGHVAGFESMMRILLGCYRLGVKTVTVYAFSIENFNRSPEESEISFDLVRTKLWDLVTNQESAINQFGWSIKFPGHRTMLAADIIERISTIESQTCHCDSMIVNICAPYTTRDDLTTAIQKTVALNGQMHGNSISESRYLAESEPLDILVRTSGETRFSDFMVWEADSNCSLEFVPQLWPEFSVWHSYRIVVKWQIRKSQKANTRQSLADLAAAPPTASVTKRKQ